MKKANTNVHHHENYSTTSCGPMDSESDHEAAGRLQSTDLHCIIVAALDGRDKKSLHYHVLKNSYISLMCASYMANHPYEIEARSPIFNQLNIRTAEEIDDHCFSLSKMRLEIHKL